MKKGFTLIELIVGIAVISISFLALITVFTTVVPRNIDVEGLTKATFLAEGKMEEILVQPFGSITDEAGTSFPAPFEKQKYAVEVHHVSADDLDSYVVPADSPDYKNVKVKVWSGLIDTIEVVTLVTTYEIE